MNNTRNEPQGGEMALTEWKKRENQCFTLNVFTFDTLFE